MLAEKILNLRCSGEKKMRAINKVKCFLLLHQPTLPPRFPLSTSPLPLGKTTQTNENYCISEQERTYANAEKRKGSFFSLLKLTKTSSAIQWHVAHAHTHSHKREDYNKSVIQVKVPFVPPTTCAVIQRKQCVYLQHVSGCVYSLQFSYPPN